MKQLTCEMCGSTDLMKQDGIFVCQSCGCKYSIEEAKKLMVEGTVDVSGSTVKVDTSSELENLYQIARRAKDDNNAENAAKYYDMILVKDPTSWEATFYVVYFQAMSCKIAQIRSAAISVSNCADSVLLLIRDHLPKNEQGAAVKEVVYRSSLIAHALTNGAKSHYDGINSDIKHDYLQEYINNASAARDILYNCGSQIDRIFGNNPEVGKLTVTALKSGIELHEKMMSYLENEQINEQIIISHVKKIGKYDPVYAKNYLVNFWENKKHLLEISISTSKAILSNTPDELHSKLPHYFRGGILLVIGIIAMRMGYYAFDGEGGILFGLCLSSIFLILGLPELINASSVGKENAKKIAGETTKLKKAQAELEKIIAELEKIKLS